MRVVFDVEANGLYEATKTWCIAAKDIDTGSTYFFGPDRISDGVAFLGSCRTLIGHNIIDFDIPHLSRLHNLDTSGVELVDTLVLSRLFWPDRVQAQGYTGKGGPHSLESWGYRVGRWKPEHNDWSQYSEEMKVRCQEDVEINVLTYFELMKEMNAHDWGESIDIEHRIQEIISRQARNGFYFDRDAARERVTDLENRISEIDDQLSQIMPGSWKLTGTSVNRPFTKQGYPTKRAENYLQEALQWLSGPFSAVTYVPMNLGSDKQVKDYLLSVGWEPISWNYNKDTGEKSSPKLEFSDDSDDGITGDVGSSIKARKLWSHRLNQIKGWIGNCRSDSTLPGQANTLGTPTGRMRHSIIVNIPKAVSYVPYGIEMRSLFRARPGRVLVGRDASQIELRMLAHYMNDEGYINAILKGDIHSYNQELAGLPTRDAAKTFIYAFNYGAGDAKLGSIVGGGASEGKSLRRSFLDACPALGKVIRSVKKASNRGFLVGLDGRRIYIRRDAQGIPRSNVAFNALLQGGASVIMKKAEIFLDQWVREEGIDAIKVIDMHDESQWDVHPDHVERFKELAELSVVKSGEHFKLNIPLAAEAKAGKNWAETH
jgi:DNA polymerase-1